MRRISLIVFVVPLALLFVSPNPAKAGSLAVVNKDGNVTINVLASESFLALSVPERGELGVKNVADEGVSSENISLSKENNIISLRVGDEKEFDVTSWKENIIEIEERPDTKSIKIELFENKFKIESGGIYALTELPITIDPSKNKFSVTTPTGDRYVSILPSDAAETVLRAKVLSETQKGMDLLEESGVLSYMVKGDKKVNLFDFYNFAVPVTAQVSASTGEIMSIDQPPWLRVLNFFLS